MNRIETTIIIVNIVSCVHIEEDFNTETFCREEERSEHLLRYYQVIHGEPSDNNGHVILFHPIFLRHQNVKQFQLGLTLIYHRPHTIVQYSVKKQSSHKEIR